MVPFFFCNIVVPCVVHAVVLDLLIQFSPRGFVFCFVFCVAFCAPLVLLWFLLLRLLFITKYRSVITILLLIISSSSIISVTYYDITFKRYVFFGVLSAFALSFLLLLATAVEVPDRARYLDAVVSVMAYEPTVRGCSLVETFHRTVVRNEPIA